MIFGEVGLNEWFQSGRTMLLVFFFFSLPRMGKLVFVDLPLGNPRWRTLNSWLVVILMFVLTLLRSITRVWV